jgi:hypothetical protein
MLSLGGGGVGMENVRRIHSDFGKRSNEEETRNWEKLQPRVLPTEPCS